MNSIAIAAKLLTDHLPELRKVNEELERLGHPPYYLGGAAFNVEYRLANTPRWVFRWWPPGVRLAQIYLYYIPGIPAGQEPTSANEITVSLN